MNTQQLIVLVAFGLGVYQINRSKVEAMELPKSVEASPVREYLPELTWTKIAEPVGWVTPPKGQPYEQWFLDASHMYQLPAGLLSRVAYQESRYNPRAISPANAQGIMQIVPKWHPNVDPFDARESIYYAAKYLRYLRNQTGNWTLALAAYNWGIENLTRKGIENAPTETRNYIAQIGADVNLP